MNKAILLLPIIACLMTAAMAVQAQASLNIIQLPQHHLKKTINILKCKDPTGHHFPCVLVISTLPPPKNTLICKDTSGHKFKCIFAIIKVKAKIGSQSV